MGTPERIAAANSALSNTLNAPEPEEGGEGEEDENEPKMSVRTIELEDEESPRRRGEQRLGSSRKKIYPQVVCPVYAGSYIGLWWWKCPFWVTPSSFWSQKRFCKRIREGSMNIGKNLLFIGKLNWESWLQGKIPDEKRQLIEGCKNETYKNELQLMEKV
jgi:hypothetical protein